MNSAVAFSKEAKDIGHFPARRVGAGCRWRFASGGHDLAITVWAVYRANAASRTDWHARQGAAAAPAGSAWW